MTAHEWLTKYLSISGSVRRGKAWQCPAHEDGSPSLSITETADGRVLMHCFGGCTVEEVLWALGLGLDVLFTARVSPPERVLSRQIRPPRYASVSVDRTSTRHRRNQKRYISIEHHVYIPDRVRLERCRYSQTDKTCRWEIRDGTLWRYAKGLLLSRLPLYREDAVRMAKAAGEVVVLCESESSVDAFMSAGIYATTWAGGSSNPPVMKLQKGLAGAVVVWIPDNDPAGMRCSAVIQDALSAVCSLHMIIPEVGEDARNLLARVGPPAMRDLIIPLGQQFGNLVDDLDDRDDLSHPSPLAFSK